MDLRSTLALHNDNQIHISSHQVMQSHATYVYCVLVHTASLSRDPHVYKHISRVALLRMKHAFYHYNSITCGHWPLTGHTLFHLRDCFSNTDTMMYVCSDTETCFSGPRCTRARAKESGDFYVERIGCREEGNEALSVPIVKRV